MGLLFRDDLHDEFGTWPLGYIPTGGADYGEVRAVAAAVGDGDDAAFCDAWCAAADRLAAEAAENEAAGRRASARDGWLRAACFYGAAYHPIFGAPVNPRLLAAFRRQIAAFDRGLALGEPAVTPMGIPLGDLTMPAYLLRAEGRADETRPLLILTNGYDGTVTDMYFASAVAAARRGYHVLVFDGPGQGGPLYEQGVPLRPDWETVIAAVVDAALELPGIDPRRIALSGWSLGGHLAARAATGEHRLAALILDPALWSMLAGFIPLAAKLGIAVDASTNLAELDEATLSRLNAAIEGNRQLRWSFVQRGYWVHGVRDLRGYLASAALFTLDGRSGEIRCPTLLAAAGDDTRSASAQRVMDGLRCPKTLIRFTSAEGAGDHCEMMNRSLLNRRTLDWLDAALGVG
ncbi:alpha/beta hydrolase family protein [Amorphus sp. MBR-141]